MIKICVTINIILLLQLNALSQTNSRKLLFIGIDGCRSDVMMSANTPSIQGLLEHAIYSSDGICTYKTWSGNGWSSMLTGVWHTKHGVTDNSFSGSNFGSYPDFITRAENFNPGLRTVSHVHWGPINNSIIGNADVKNTYATDLEVKNSAILSLTSDNPDILFIAFDDVDHTGHQYGFSPNVAEYVESIELTDQYVGEILEAMYNRPNYANEDWLVVVTTDHGGIIAGHGGGTLEERTIFNIFSNPTFTTEEHSKSIFSDTLNFTSTQFNPGTFANPVNPSELNFGISENFTIEFWVKPNSFSGDPSMISNKDWDSGLNRGFVISAIQGPYWKVNIGDGSSRKDIQGGFLSPGEWHHLAVSFDRNGMMKAYENGVVVGFEWINNIGDINSGLPLTINQDGSTIYAFNMEAQYKDIRVWNAVLTNETLIQWALQPITTTHPNYEFLLANWTGVTNSNNQLLDFSPQANHCAITGNTVDVENTNATFTVYDFLNTPREPDNAVTALNWMCIPVEFQWDLDGRSWVTECAGEPVSSNSLSYVQTVFPNPAQSLLNFSTSIIRQGNYEIFDSQGKLVFQGFFSSSKESEYQSLNIQHLKNGIYKLRLSNNNVHQVTTFSVTR